MVKCRCKRITEIPIHFEDRIYGKSKLTFTEQLKYIQHIRRLYIYSFNQFSELVQFAVVGASGVLVNLLVLTLCLSSGLPNQVSVAAAIAVSIVTNFILNRRFTFSYAKDGPLLQQFVKYIASVMFGAFVNYLVTLALIAHFLTLPPQIAALVGIAAGTTIMNFAAMKFLVFRKRHVRQREK